MKLMKLLTIMTFMLCFVGCQKQEGRSQALEDVTNNKAKYLLYGELMPFEKEIAIILKKKYGVTLERVADCIVTDDIIKYCDSYNEVICEKFKKDIYKTELKRLNHEYKKQKKLR